MKHILNNLSGSFNNIAGDGWGGKKLTAFAITGCVVLAHLAWIHYSVTRKDFRQLEMVLGINYTFIATLFGINEYGKKVTKKDEPKDPA